jgi:hypothetical protein
LLPPSPPLGVSTQGIKRRHAFHGAGGSALSCGRDTSDTGMVGASEAVGDLVSVCMAAVAGQWDTAAMEVQSPLLSSSRPLRCSTSWRPSPGTVWLVPHMVRR